MQSLDRTHDLLRVLAARAIPTGQHFDRGGEQHVVVSSPTWEDFVNLGTYEVRQAGSSQLQVLRLLRALLLDVGSEALPQRHPPLSLHLAMLDSTIEKSLDQLDDRLLAVRPDMQGKGGAGRTLARA